MTLELESESGLFQIDVECPRNQYILSITGELDLANASLLQEHLLEAAQTDVGDVVVDLEHATYIDSAGLGVLVSAHKRLTAVGGTLIICSPTPRVMKVFEITGLSSYLHIRT